MPFFKVARIFVKYLGNFYIKFSHQELSKIAESSHTDYNACSS